MIILLLTIIIFLFTIGCTAITISLLIEKDFNRQYMPTQPTRPMTNSLKNKKELANDITVNNSFFDDDLIIKD